MHLLLYITIAREDSSHDHSTLVAEINFSRKTLQHLNKLICSAASTVSSHKTDLALIIQGFHDLVHGELKERIFGGFQNRKYDANAIFKDPNA